MHQLDNCIGVLKRWAAVSDEPMPQSWEAFSKGNASAAMAIEQADPELVALLSNRAGAALRVQALTGELPERAATAEERASAEQESLVQEILASTDGNPYGSPDRYEGEAFVPGRPANLTAAMTLEGLRPELAAKLKAQANPAAPAHNLTPAEVALVQQHGGFALPTA